MPEEFSLPANRNLEKLTEHQVELVNRLFGAFEPGAVTLEWENEYGARSFFEPRTDEYGQEYGVIRLGPDIFPGKSVGNPNAVLDVYGAVAHEIEHFYRWQSGYELPAGWHRDLDEALTSLQAVCRQQGQLTKPQLVQLVSDALHRLTQHVELLKAAEADSEAD